MDRSYEITDSSDWLKTPVAPLGPVEAALRCQVCKDFYNTPMITSCSHTFCSLCIRRCLTSDGKCPSCRASDQELRLRRNWVVEELVDAFKTARPSILRLGQDLVEAKDSRSPSLQKRKLGNTDFADDERSSTSQRKTRSQSRRSPKSLQENDNPQEVLPNLDGVDLESGIDLLSTPSTPTYYRAEDNLAACPICGQRMKVEDVFPHLDICQGSKRQIQPQRIQHPPASNPAKKHPLSTTPAKQPDRLPSLSYSILNENALRKKFTALGIPNWGPKQLLIRRHTEWVNLWNANCDSSRPRSKRELLSDLDVWERTQGGNAPSISSTQSGPNTIMRKDFDGAAWAANHGNDFKRLIAEARQKGNQSAKGSAGKAVEPPPSPGGTQPSEDMETMDGTMPGVSHYEQPDVAKASSQLSVIDLERGDPIALHEPSKTPIHRHFEEVPSLSQ